MRLHHRSGCQSAFSDAGHREPWHPDRPDVRIDDADETTARFAPDGQSPHQVVASDHCAKPAVVLDSPDGRDK
jgi:hypothetical protein